MTHLAQKKCIPCQGDVKPLTLEKAHELHQELHDWKVDDIKQEIHKRYEFKNFYKTMAFVNAIAWVANQENHHPDMHIGYNYCSVLLKTHAISGLSENDFILAAKIDQLGTL
jgi:4a-hydroxytetrahydrobiopterin dehydratase